MLVYNLDERKFYLGTRNFKGEIVKIEVSIPPEDILFYLNAEIVFEGEKEVTLRQVRTLIKSYDKLCIAIPSINDFLETTKSIGFNNINKKNKKSQKIIFFKIINVQKSEGELSELCVSNTELFGNFLESKIIKKRNVRVENNFFIFSQHPLVEMNEEELKEEYLNNYNGCGVDKLDYLLDLSCEQIFDVPLSFREYLFEVNSKIKEELTDGFVLLEEPEESLESVSESTLTLLEFLNVISTTIQNEIMLDEDFEDFEGEEEINFEEIQEKFETPKKTSIPDNIIKFPPKKEQ